MKPLVSFYKNSLFLVIMLCVPVWIFSYGTARAEPENFLSFGIAGGVAIAPDATLETSPAAGEADFDTGYSFKTSLGVVLANQFQLDAEYLHTDNNISSLINAPAVTPLTVSDRVTNNLMLSALYRVDASPPGDIVLAPKGMFIFFGAGAGVSWQDYTVETLGSGSDASFAWQVILGVEQMNPSQYLFASFPSPFLQYRFVHIDEGDFGAFKADASMHLVEFGFRFYGALGD